MKYCKTCFFPDTQPSIKIDDNGVCNFCRYYKSIENVDWDKREKELRIIAESAKDKNREYDCVVGVSGGKDSTTIALYARDVLGLRVLLASMVPDGITENGKKNMDNIQKMGFDCVMVRPNPKVCKAIAKMAFYKWCNPVKPSEYALYATPVRVALMYNVPLIIFDMDVTTLDDDSKDTTKGDASKINEMNTLGFTGKADHLLCEGVELKDLGPYQYPSQDEIVKSGLKIVYLGYFKRWSTHVHAKFAIERGLNVRTEDLHELGRYTNYHALDDDTGIVNQMIKHVKFGYGFATEEANADIWAGRITREEGIELIKEYDGKISFKFIKQFCDYIGISPDEFWNVVDKFRGPMWKKSKIDEWVLDNPIWEQ